MSALATEHHAINLAQGFPEFPVSETLIELVYHYMVKGHNQYAPMPGLLRLRERIAEKIATQYLKKVNPETEITITAGATEGLYTTIAALVRPGDEVVILEPAYDSYIPAILLQGGIPVTVAMNRDFSVDWPAVEEKVSPKTRMIIVNTPHNPSGMVFSAEDWQQLSNIVQKHGIWVLSDEVYEHIIFDGLQHQSVLRYEALARHCVAVFSFGKTFHATGWKVGYVVASAALTQEIRKAHQYLQFSVHTPTQYALADFLENENHYTSLGSFYQKKRDLFLRHMQTLPFQPLKAKGTYFQLFSYKNYTDFPDRQFANYLTREAKVASIPISVFYQDKTDHHYLRFCFAKHDETLIQAAHFLSQFL